ncbi:MAG: polyprenyl synthetase family protein [Okeania sp. SIO3B5]|nr:polyprenyl synthetase family protein [Okeania sp. SIO3B5]
MVKTAPEVKIEPIQFHPPKQDHSNGHNGNQSSSSNGHLELVQTAPELKVEPTQFHPPKQDHSNGHNGNQSSSSNGHLELVQTAPEAKVEPTQFHPPKQDHSNGHNGNQSSSSNGHLELVQTAPEAKVEPTQFHLLKQDHSNGHNGNQSSSSNGHLELVQTAPEAKVEPTQFHPLKQDHSNGRYAGKATTIPLPNGGSIQLPGEPKDIATLLDVEKPQFDKTIINETLQQSRTAITGRIMQFIDFKRDISGGYAQLYEMLKDYPFRKGKMLRPTMCISAARAMGGTGDRALTTAAALELYHNAFLIHDDIEDGSESRRGKETLHHAIGVARAINVGDATNVLAVGLLLENLSAIGIQKTLSVLHEIEFMAQQSVEGQAMELDWVANNTGYLTDQDYFTMCVKKTCWYTFMTPLRIGLIIGHPTANLTELVKPLADITRFGMILGIAFQIQDDLLNILGDLKTYGKEIGGDIYEGKRTIMLNHVIANSNAADRILEILALPRQQKTPKQIGFILEEMKRCGSIDHGWYLARTLANQADNIFESLDFLKPESPLQPGENWGSSLQDRRFLKQLINYVIYRNL